MTVKNSSVTDAFQVVEQGLKSMQALQKETAEAHKKFLETQSTASQTLQQMMAQTQRLTEIALGVETPLEVPTDTLQAQPAVIPEPAAVPVFAAPAPTVERPAPVIQSVQSKPESPTPSRSAPPASVPPAAPPEPGNTPEATPRESTAPRQDIQGHILEVVSSLTGYPQEMLGMDMDIESDLGIDSIKRVEILSTLEEKVSGLPAISPEIMGSLKTLGQIAQYLTPAETAAPAEAKQSEPAAPAPPPQASDETDLVERKVISLQGTHLKKKPEINIPPDRRIYILKDETGLSDALVDTFTNLGLDAASVSLKSLSSVKKRPLACGLLIPYAGLPKKPLQAAFKLARRFGRELMESARSGGAFFGAVTRMDGGFGFKQTGFDDPLQGGLAGLVKTAALEWDGVCCRIFDLAPNWRDIPQAAQAICTSLLQPPGEQPVEIGLDPDLAPDMAHTLDLVPSAYPQGDLNVTPEDVFLITGGARGVTAAAAHALAAAAKPTLILLGRSPTPTPEPEWLLPLQDEGAIKKQLLQNQTDPKSMSPRDLETLYKQHMANREILKNLSDLNQTGATAVYYSVDVCDAKEVCEIVRATSSRYGQVTGIIHGAGVLEDRLIVDKTDDQFKRVLKTKVDGLSNLLKAVKGMDLKYLILFSSIAARMGNRGQADYAMANEVLNKTARMEAFNRTACRVISVNWGPWDGGMVTPALKREFAQRDIKLIPIKAGARSLLQEMRGEPGGDVEVVIGGNLQHALLAQTDTRTESIKKTAAPVFTLTSQRELVIEDYPILKSHMLDRKPVVPFALCAEWLGHSALHGNPGLVLQGFNDMRLFNGIVLDGAPKTIRFMAGKIQPNHTAYHVEVQIRDGVPNGEDILHYGATAILSERLTDPPEFKIPVDISSAPYSRSLQEVYDKILFHGHDLQGIQAISSLSPRGMIAKLSAAPAPEKWMSNPPRSAWIADPLILDAAFQMATLWCYEQKGMVSLPSYASAFRRYQNRFPSAGVTAVLDVREASDYKLKGDLTFIGPDDKVVARLSGYEAIMDASLYKAFKPDAAK